MTLEYDDGMGPAHDGITEDAGLLDDATLEKDDKPQLSEDDFDDGMGDVPVDGTDVSSDDSTDTADDEQTSDEDGGEPDVGFSPSLLGLARSMGVSEEDARAFPSEGALQQALFLMDRQRRSVPTPPNTGDSPPEEDEIKPFEVGLSPDEFDPEYVNTLKGMSEHHAAAFKKLYDEVRTLKQSVGSRQYEEQVRSAQEFESRFDGFIAAADDFREVLGEGRGHEMDRSSEAYKNRVDLLREMSVIAAGHAAVDQTPPSEKVIFEKAVRSLFGDRLAKNARKGIASKLDARSKNITNRPSAKNKSKSQATNDPERDAREFVSTFIRDQGLFDD